MANERLDHVEKLRAIFERALSAKGKSPLTLNEFRDNMHRAASSAAFAKVVEYNVAANQANTLNTSYAIMCAGLRGICEDLIALKFLLRFETDVANGLVLAAAWSEIRSGIKRQREFIPLNNPHQMIVGSLSTKAEIQSAAIEADKELKERWKTAGFSRRPKIEAQAEVIGLGKLYAYLYFAASNYTHHNARTLLMTGWGPKDGGDTDFSASHLSDYYRAFNSFYGALLYCGFVWSGLPIDNIDAHTGIAPEIEELLKGNRWWPEIVTRDEMNLTKPLLTEIMQAFAVHAAEAPEGASIFDDLKRDHLGRPAAGVA